MKYKKSINITFFILFSSSLLFSCRSNKNTDFDLSNLPVIKQKEVITIKDNEDVINPNKEFIKDLVPFKNKDKVLSQFKFGKEDPFSESEFQVTKLYSDFKLTGFLNTEKEKYVFVRYLGNEGSISGDSIGGLNTNLLPNGAKVIYIDTKERQLKINFNNEDYIFEF